MGICRLRKIGSWLLLCFVFVNAFKITMYAKEEDTELKEIGGIERDYIYCDERNENTNDIHADYVEVYGLDDKCLEEKINVIIQQLMLDDVFGEYISSLKGSNYTSNELGDVRAQFVSHGIDYGGCYLYGDILSIHRDISSYNNGDIDKESGVRVHSKNISTYYDMCNINVSTGESIALKDIFVIDDNFFENLKEVDILLYNDKEEAAPYDKLVRHIESEEVRKSIKEGGHMGDIRWLIDDKGNLLIHDTTWYYYSKIPLYLFRENMQPEYKEYAEQIKKGYKFEIPYNKDNLLVNVWSTYSIDNPLENVTSEIERDKISFLEREYQYEDDIRLEYFQIKGVDNVALQGEINDYIFNAVMNDGIKDLNYAYLNNGYYGEDSTCEDRESLICVESILPNYYLNGPVLSFTHTEKVIRKAYTTEEGIRKEEISKGPYFQAFNYDISKGKELEFGDVFEADDELFDAIDQWFEEESGYYDWDSEWKYDEESYQNFGKSIGIRFMSSVSNAESRDEFIHGESIHYHWFIDQSEEGSNLCIYRYNTIDTEEKCLKIPMSILKDKIKPEYEELL